MNLSQKHMLKAQGSSSSLKASWLLMFLWLGLDLPLVLGCRPDTTGQDLICL